MFSLSKSTNPTTTTQDHKYKVIIDVISNKQLHQLPIDLIVILHLAARRCGTVCQPTVSPSRLGRGSIFTPQFLISPLNY
jgi:hypothetical protein